MERIKSNNPNRTEENKDMFDHYEGEFVLYSDDKPLFKFCYTGNNIQESIEKRESAKNHALDLRKSIIAFNPNIEVVEKSWKYR